MLNRPKLSRIHHKIRKFAASQLLFPKQRRWSIFLAERNMFDFSLVFLTAWPLHNKTPCMIMMIICDHCHDVADRVGCPHNQHFLSHHQSTACCRHHHHYLVCELHVCISYICVCVQSVGSICVCVLYTVCVWSWGESRARHVGAAGSPVAGKTPAGKELLWAFVKDSASTLNRMGWEIFWLLTGLMLWWS